MCGIFGFVSKKPLYGIPIVIDGLKRLEYRGYDSAGLAAVLPSGVFLKKKAGRITELENAVRKDVSAQTFIGQTRWATHGKPVDKNAHPHSSCDRSVHLVHNGIIENYRPLKEALLRKGHRFTSDTDTEVVAHLVEDYMKSAGDFEEAVRRTLKTIRGTYALVIVHRDYPDTIIAARNSSPLLLGVADGENYVASDASALLPYTRSVMYVRDGEYAVLTPERIRMATLERKTVRRGREEIDWSPEAAQKNQFPHFMLKEIFEEPEAVENSIRGRLIMKEGLAKLGGLEMAEKDLRAVKRLVLTACGTANYAALVGEYMLEEYAGIPVEVELGSELRYRKSVIQPGTALLAISQSGETADTLGAIRELKRKGLKAYGIVNVVGSSITRETDAGVYNHAGPEIGVASTKAFVSQLAVLALWTLFLGRQRDMAMVMGRRIATELSALPKKMRAVLVKAADIKKIARKYAKYDDFLFLGRKYNYPIALEGALKLKESSYVHAEGYGAGEMKHGPLAMIDKNFPSVVIAPSDSVYEKVASNIQELKARSGKVIAIATEGNREIAKIADDVIYIPRTLEMLTPILSVMPLHLFAYYSGVLRGRDVDKPRNLAKSVTVE